MMIKLHLFWSWVSAWHSRWIFCIFFWTL